MLDSIAGKCSLMYMVVATFLIIVHTIFLISVN